MMKLFLYILPLILHTVMSILLLGRQVKIDIISIVAKLPELRLRHKALEWLAANRYIMKIGKVVDAWENVPYSYRLNWDFVKAKLCIEPPSVLEPLSLEREVNDQDCLPRCSHYSNVRESQFHNSCLALTKVLYST
jgi:hypothetical protein